MGAVLEQVQPRARGVYGDGMARAGCQGQELRRYGACRGAFAQRLQAQLGFLLQLAQQGGAGFGAARNGLARRYLRGQQVAIEQLCELELGVVAHQALGMGQGIAPAPLADEAVSLDQPALGLPVTRRGGCRLARCGRGLACGV